MEPEQVVDDVCRFLGPALMRKYSCACVKGQNLHNHPLVPTNFALATFPVSVLVERLKTIPN